MLKQKVSLKVTTWKRVKMFIRVRARLKLKDEMNKTDETFWHKYVWFHVSVSISNSLLTWPTDVGEKNSSKPITDNFSMKWCYSSPGAYDYFSLYHIHWVCYCMYIIVYCLQWKALHIKRISFFLFTIQKTCKSLNTCKHFHYWKSSQKD